MSFYTANHPSTTSQCPPFLGPTRRNIPFSRNRFICQYMPSSVIPQRAAISFIGIRGIFRINARISSVVFSVATRLFTPSSVVATLFSSVVSSVVIESPAFFALDRVAAISRNFFLSSKRLTTNDYRLTTKYALAPWGMQPNTSLFGLSPI